MVSYSILVSVDGEPDRKMVVGKFNSDLPESKIAFVPIELERKEEGEVDQTASKERVLKPHTVRITSLPETPIRFDGLMVENTIIQQGLGWIEQQNKRLNVEFVGADVDLDTRGGLVTAFKDPWQNGADLLVQSHQWQAAEALKIRHSHIDAGYCLTYGCDQANPLPGLEDQYFNENPLNNTLPFSRTADFANTDPRHPKNFEVPWKFQTPNPLVPFGPPKHIVVDTGVFDIVVHRMDREKYEHSLAVFLARMRQQSYPNAHIVVIARKPTSTPPLRHSRERLELDGYNIHSLRKALYDATVSAVKAVKRETFDDKLEVVVIDPSSNPQRDLEKALCKSVVPPPQSLLSSWSHPEDLTAPQLHCKSLNSLRASNVVEEVEGTDVLWAIFFIALCAVACYVARDTIKGSLAVVFGRKLLGMPPAMEEGRFGMHPVDESKVYHVRRPTGDYSKIG